MTDYTEQQLKDAAVRAYQDGNVAAAKRLIAEAQRVAAPAPAPEPTPERGFGDVLYENIIGRGEVDTPGERLGELIRGGTAAVARGMADIPALPANIAQLAAFGVEKATGMEEPSLVSRQLAKLPETREMLASIPGIGPETEYVAPGTLGEFVSTAGEMAGGAGVLGGPSAMLKFGVLPGVASEAAGQAVEGTPAEPYVRAAAAIGAPMLAGRVVSPFGGADPERIKLAKTLERAGVKPTAGQATGSSVLRAIEGTGQATPQQLDDFTAAVMKSVGSTSKRATPEAMASAEKAIFRQMDDVLNGVPITPNMAMARNADDIARQYLVDAPSASVVPRVRNTANEIIEAATSPTSKTFTLDQLRVWRTSLGRMTLSQDEATRNAAHALRKLIDDATDAALSSAGRADDLGLLREARVQYRNFLAVEDAVSKAGPAAATGVVSPAPLRSAIVRSQGKRAYVTGRGTETAELARAGAGVLDTAPTVLPSGARHVPEITTAGLAAGGAYAAGLPGAIAGVAAPIAGRAAALSPPLQRYFANQLAQSTRLTDPRMLAPVAGLLE